MTYQPPETPKKLNNDESFTLAPGSRGLGRIVVGKNEEFAYFSWDEDAVVDLQNNSSNVVDTDTDTKLCVFDDGAYVAVKNRLGATKDVLLILEYYTP